MRFVAARPFVRYFTACIKPEFARAADSVQCQQDYHRALQAICHDRLVVHLGNFDARRAELHRHCERMRPRDGERVPVWQFEEKQSDVSIGLHAYRDAVRGEVDTVVIVTNDTDQVPTLSLLRSDTGSRVGLVVPTKDAARRPNADLAQVAHWCRTGLTRDELAAAQLPDMVRVEQRVVHRPITWYPRPDLLQPIFDEVRRVRRSNGAARKWLNTSNSWLGNRRPIDLAQDDALVGELWAYLQSYAESNQPDIAPPPGDDA